MDLANQAMAITNQINAATAGITSAPNTYQTYYLQAGGYADKGLTMLGEGGYEFVINNPTTKALESALGEKLTQEKLLGAVVGNEGGISKAVIEVWLSPGLEGEIVDKALSEAATVFDTVIRRR
jgi:hypothetical protein